MKKKLLVIDDDEGILEAFKTMLESAGYDVITQKDPDNLTALISDTSLDLIILDVLLSGIDGRDISKGLKSNDATKHIPIIMVSAHPSVGKSGKKLFADDFLAKPFEMNELLTKVEKYMKK